MQLPFQSKQAQERKHHRKIDFRDAASTAAFLIVFIGIWEVIFLLGVFPIVSLPSPLMVAQSLVDLIAEGTLIYSTAVTLLRLFVGFSTSITSRTNIEIHQFNLGVNNYFAGKYHRRVPTASQATGHKLIQSCPWHGSRSRFHFLYLPGAPRAASAPAKSTFAR